MAGLREWCITKCIQILTQDDSASSSSSSSSEDELEVLQVLDMVKNTPTRPKFNSLDRSMDLAISRYTETEFVSHFRIKRSLYFSLCYMFRKSLQYQNMSLNHHLQSPEKHMLVFLWFAGHKACSLQNVGDRFNISKAEVHVLLKRVLHFLCQKSSNLIRWPNQYELGETSEFFRSKYGFPKVIGCIGASQVVIDSLNDERISSMAKRVKTSLGVQVVCNEKKKIINVHISSPGNVINSGILRDSPVNNKLQQLGLHGCNFVLGDSSYPCKTYLLTPYKDDGDLSESQMKYNEALQLCLTHIRDCLSALKWRFPGLHYCKLRDVTAVSQFITGCCVLHNFADPADLDILKEAENLDCNYYSESDFEISDNDKTGLKRREQICLRYF